MPRHALRRPRRRPPATAALLAATAAALAASASPAAARPAAPASARPAAPASAPAAARPTATAAAGPAALAAATPPRCTVAQLRGSLTHLTAGAGSRFATLVLRNTSRRPCSLFGYPGALLLSRSGRALPTRVLRDRSRRPRTVVVRPRGRAVSQWRWGAIPGPREPARGRCEPLPRRIEVTPPNATRQLVLPWRSGPVCEHGTITVRPMRLP